MNIVIHDVGSNTYLSAMYFGPLASYMRNLFLHPEVTRDVSQTRDSVVLIHGDVISPSLILDLKARGNEIVVFDINDSSYFSSAYHTCQEKCLIDVIFKVSGVPKKNETQDISIDRNFQFISSPVNYLPEAEYKEFAEIRPRIHSLPYVLWNALVPPHFQVEPWSARRNKVLVRGGNHFWRVVLYMNLLKAGIADDASMFASEAYFHESMEERFKFCSSCIDEWKVKGRTEWNTEHPHTKCKSPATWGSQGDFCGGPLIGRNEFGYWNNRCPASFLWLAKEFEKAHGPIDRAKFERAINGCMAPPRQFINDLSKVTLYSDLKWISTIYAPPRFWEAASVGTVCLLPDRTDDQDYFPVIKPWEHYVPFPLDMSSFPEVTEAQWTYISNNVKKVYEEQIRGTQYPISSNLLAYIMDHIRPLL